MSMFQDTHENNGELGEFFNGFTYFQYRASLGNAPFQGDWGIKHGFFHEIACCDGSVRFANIKKTVAYIMTDTDEEGKPVVEKWKIKHIWRK